MTSKRDEGVLKADEVLGVRIKNTKIVLGAVIAAGRDFLKTLRSEPSINLRKRDGHDVKTRLGGDDGEVVCLIDDALQTIEAGHEFVLQ